MADEHIRARRRQALALAYRDGEEAPRLVAKGYGEVAERIIAEARRHGVPIHDSPELVGLLMQVDLDARIPPQLYQVVGELLAWAARLQAVQK
jgi:flagellar biosynthesis protein